jgi:hypothetical protein
VFSLSPFRFLFSFFFGEGGAAGVGLLFQEASLSCPVFFLFFFPFGVEFSVLDSLLCLLLWSEREGKRVFFVVLLRVCLLGVYVYVFLFFLLTFFFSLRNFDNLDNRLGSLHQFD